MKSPHLIDGTFNMVKLSSMNAVAYFEKVLKAIRAKNVFGLTATPIRKMDYIQLFFCSAVQFAIKLILKNKRKYRR